ncbi:MAG: MBL fold metallo-hydrolase, partial [Muribaculaceae bacterium]|nr:MBL fold metallo-hydrolase [Muribaculaceae bacterium]
PIYTSSFGKEAFNKSNWNFSRYHEDPIEIESASIKAVSGEDAINIFQDTEVKVLETPGHDKSSLTFRIGNYLFTGDSFIPGVKVIASFPNSNREDAQYWYERLKELSENYIVCPGHGEILSR